LTKRKAVSPTSTPTIPTSTVDSGDLDFSDAVEVSDAPAVAEEKPPPPEVSIPPGGISRDGSMALGGNGNMAVPPFDENKEG
jgi:hypothetical protein